MDNRRLFLLLALGLILILLWTSWRNEHPPATSRAIPAAAATAQMGEVAPSGGGPAAGAVKPAGGHASLTAPGGATIRIRTDVLDLTIALHGAVIVRAALLDYPLKEGSKEPVSLLTSERDRFLVASLDLGSADLPRKIDYVAARKTYTLAPGQQTLNVPLSWSRDGVTVTRILHFVRGSYVVGVTTGITSGGKALAVTPGISFAGRNPVTAAHFWDHFLPKYWAFRGLAYYDGSYVKRDPPSLAANPVDKNFRAGWIGSILQYFVAVAIPPRSEQVRYFAEAIGPDGYEAGYVQPTLEIPAGAKASTSATLFLGPKRQGMLGRIAPGLQRTVDYGKATIICVPMFWILSHIHGLLGNWGWSIILLVLLIKVLFYWPQRISARSMAKMRKLQPRIKHLQERYKDDRQKLSQATMELYRKEGANPVSGCLPMLIQVPIFFGLFYVLTDSVELRQAPWMLWIHDLSAPDPFYILPVLFALVSLVQFRLQPQAVDNAQAKMMMFMPLLFTFMYAIFPAGLVLYYLLNTILNVAIQWQVNKELGIPMGLGFSLKKKS